MSAWIQTFTDKQFWPLDPKVEDICIEDIAHALSLKCRFGGHCKIHYSVAEHSVYVSRHLPAEMRLAGLLHDAAEAYSPFGDVPRPVKRELPFVEVVETKLDVAIAERFGVTFPWPERVKEIDTAILHDEKRKLLGEPPADWGLPGTGLGAVIHVWPWWYAEKQFLAEFRRLVG